MAEIISPLADEPKNEAELHAWIASPGLPVEAGIATTLVLVSKVLERTASRLTAPHSVTLPQWMAMRVLRHAGPAGLSLTALSRCLMLSKAPITGIMDRLERDGLARRVVDRADRRVVRAVITEAGVRKFESIKADFSEWKDRAFAGFNDAEKAAFAAMLDRLLIDILAQPEGAPEAP